MIDEMTMDTAAAPRNFPQRSMHPRSFGHWFFRLALTVILTLTAATHVLADAASDYDVAIQHYKAPRYELAAGSFSDFIKKYPTNERRPMAELYLGQSLMHLRKFSEARGVFSSFLNANSNHPDAALAMYREAECTFFLNEWAKGTTLFESFLQRFPENDLSAWAWYYLGESQLRLSSAERAATAFQSGLDKFPNSQRTTESRFGLARAYQALKQLDKASEAYRAISADATNPRAADALFYLGSMEFDAQRFTEAAAAFTTLREKFPTYRQAAEAALNAGSSYYQIGEFDKAVEAFDVAAASPKDKLTARFWAGQARRSQKKYDEAIAINKAAYNEFKDDPNAAKLLYYWGDCEFRKGDSVKAIPLFVQFVDTYPNHDFADDSLHYAVDAALNDGNVQQAELLHERFTKEFPRSGLTMLESILYGRVLLAKADVLSPMPPLSVEAKAAVQAAADIFANVIATSKIERTNAWATLLLARSRFKLGDFQDVIAAATPLNERLVKLEKPAEFAESLFLTGRAAAELQQWELADASFERYLTISNDADNAAAALSQLVLARAKAGKLDQLDTLWPRFTAANIAPGKVAEVVLAAANLAEEQQRYQEAATLFDKLEKMSEAPQLAAAARSGLGHARFNLRDYPGAADAFGRLTAAPPENDPVLVADAAFMKGYALEKATRLEEAAGAYLAGALMIAGRDGKLSDPPGNPEAAYNAYRCMNGAALQFEALNDIDKANDAYAQAWEYLGKLPIDRKADLDKLVYRWARANYVAMKYERADELYQRLLTDHPASSLADDAAYYLAESMLQSGKAAEAEAQLKKIYSDPKTDEAIRPEVLNKLIELAADREDWTAAKTYSNELIDRYPTSPNRLNAKYRLGEAALMSSDVSTARVVFTDLRQTIEKGDKSSTPDFAEGVWILSAETEMAAAPRGYAGIDKLAEEFHAKFPQSGLAYQIDYVHGRSFILRAPPEVEKAREILQKVVDSPTGEKTETAANADFKIAESYVLSGKPDDLQTAYRRFYDVAVKYNSPEIQAAALLQAGDVQRKLGNTDKAIDAYRELVTQFPKSPLTEEGKTRLKDLKADVTPAPAAPGDKPADPPKSSSLPGELTGPKPGDVP